MYYKSNLDSPLSIAIQSIIERMNELNVKLIDQLKKIEPGVEKIVPPTAVSGGVAVGVVFSKKYKVPNYFVFYDKKYHVPNKSKKGEFFSKKMKLPTDQRIDIFDLNRKIGFDTGKTNPEIRILENQKIMLFSFDSKYADYFTPTALFEENTEEILFSEYKALRENE